MATRKKSPAALRTIGLFTGKTPLEEAEGLLLEEQSQDVRADEPRDLVAEAEDCAIKWLGMDAFAVGDDVKIAEHPDGHAVLILVYGGKDGAPVSTRTHKLTKRMWTKLKELARSA